MTILELVPGDQGLREFCRVIFHPLRLIGRRPRGHVAGIDAPLSDPIGIVGHPFYERKGRLGLFLGYAFE